MAKGFRTEGPQGAKCQLCGPAEQDFSINDAAEAIAKILYHGEPMLFAEAKKVELKGEKNENKKHEFDIIR